jgi:hypothetical protein
MFNPRLGEPKLEEPNGNDHHVSENGELKYKKNGGNLRGAREDD